MRSRAHWPTVIFTVITLAYLLLLSGQVVTAIGVSRFDDGLFINLATEIGSGHWLGRYNNVTLAKGPTYPLFIALNSALRVPLLLSEHILYALSCLVFVRAIHNLLRNAIVQYLLYALMLFSPASWSILRVMREGIYPALTVFVIGALFGLAVRRNAPVRWVVPWSIGLGLALGAFWLTREEGVWILPAVALTLGATVILMWRERPSETRLRTFLLQRVSLCVAPLAILGACIFTLAAVNRIEYGVFTTNEFKSKDFLAAYGALSRVEPDRWQRYIPVPQQTRMDIYQVSPAFAEIKTDLEVSEQRWMIPGCTALPTTCGDYGGGWFMWALRDAVRDARYYRSASSAAGYYARLASEVNHACDTHALSCGPERQSLQPPWQRVYATQLPPTLYRASRIILQLRDVSTGDEVSTGTEAQSGLFRSVTHNAVAPRTPPRSQSIRIMGWAVNPKADTPVTLRVIAPDGREGDASTKFAASPDVHDHLLKDEGKNFASAAQARFTLTTTCLTGCRLVVLANGMELGGVALDSSESAVRSDTLELFIDSVEALPAIHVPFDSGVGRVQLAIMNGITAIYRTILPGLVLLSVIAILLAMVGFVRGRRSILLFFIAILGIEIVARLVVIALVDITSFPDLYLLYLSPVYPLLLACAGVSLLEAWHGYQEPVMRRLRAVRLRRMRLRRVSQ